MLIQEVGMVHVFSSKFHVEYDLYNENYSDQLLTNIITFYETFTLLIHRKKVKKKHNNLLELNRTQTQLYNSLCSMENDKLIIGASVQLLLVVYISVNTHFFKRTKHR